MNSENGPIFFGDMGLRVVFSGNNGLGIFDRPIIIQKTKRTASDAA
jgi:hypothetical protein